MKLSERLLKLDQKVGFRPTSYEESQWERNAKLWWVAPSFLLPTSVASAVVGSGVIDWRLAIQVLGTSLVFFMAGFFYNERLRHLGKKSSIPVLRDPDHKGDLKGRV
ncbi:MAG TPA: hypothetical protein VND22_10205 [Actinomycetota bacterium]|nr:hypothetical protein [Actinomycetota bacterium]